LTGHWQVSGKNKTTFNEMIAMDLFYLENMSVLLDLKIMLNTGAVIAGQLLESRRQQPASGAEVNRTKLERAAFPRILLKAEILATRLKVAKSVRD